MIFDQVSGWSVKEEKASITRAGRVAALFAGSAATVVLTACNSGTTTSPDPATSVLVPPTTSAASSSPLSPVDKAKQDALVSYQGMWQDFVAAGTNSDWQSPKLGQYATGVALTNMSRGLYADHYNGLVTKGEPVLNPTVTSADPADNPKKIVITDCGDSTHWLKYRADNGQLADSDPGGRQSINAIVEKQADGSWKVSDYGVHEVGTC